MAEVINPAIVPKVTLPSGEQVPCVGMGTFGSDRVSAEDVSAAVAGAIRSGYRMFDCAACYGNEHEIGQVFKDAFDEGVVERKDLFIMTKVWNDMHRRVEEACDKSIKDLQCDYVDMYYIHWPFPNYHAPGCDVDSRNPDSKPFSVDEFMDTYRQCEALVEKGKDVADKDWEELDNMAKIKLNGSKCSVSIVPDTEKGTSADSDSGMQGVYMTISSDLTLSGTPKDPGSYLFSVSIEDQQGRSAVSNTLPFRIYSGEETLADQMKKENFKDYGNGLYAWDIMEPWAISKFGSNVNGEEESVRVPAYLEAWFGSHESGTYGYLGYDIPWKQVVAGNIPQTLYIPSGCNLTLTNMEVLSSVHIIVENGGKLTLSDSVVQGIIDVQSGGTFSMNYDSFNNEFTTGASLCGQLRLADGAALENAAIYSHANYLANGDLTDRTTSEPVAVANGNVTVKGTVAILGDDGGSDIGQTALRVNGTLTLADKDTTLVAYGGSGKTLLYTDGGTAIDITEGSQITGDGKLVAIGGDVLWGNGGNAVSGKGTIATKKVFLQGCLLYTSDAADE